MHSICSLQIDSYDSFIESKRNVSMVGLRGSISQSQANLYRIYVVLKVVPKLENLEVYIPG